MKGQLSRQISIARHIADGSIIIDSVREFQRMLQIFPNDPALHRAYADLLVINGNPLDDLQVLKDRNNMQLIIKDGHVWKNTLVDPAHPYYVPPEQRAILPSPVL